MKHNDRTPTDALSDQEPTDCVTAAAHRRQMDAIWERAYAAARGPEQ